MGKVTLLPRAWSICCIAAMDKSAVSLTGSEPEGGAGSKQPQAGESCAAQGECLESYQLRIRSESNDRARVQQPERRHPLHLPLARSLRRMSRCGATGAAAPTETVALQGLSSGIMRK